MQIITGDILDFKEGILVQGCNCQGAMGSGVAKAIMDQYPGVAQRYKERHAEFGLQLGDVQYVWSPKLLDSLHPGAGQAHLRRKEHCLELPERLVIANAMTQEFYGKDKSVRYVSYPAVFAAFARIRLLAKATGLPIAFPLIGAGLANGEWSRVQPAIEAGLRELFKTAQLWVKPGTEVPSA